MKPIMLKTNLGFDFFDFDEIIMIEAKGHNSFVYAIDREKPVFVRQSLSSIEKRFCNGILKRCHKSFIININYIEELCSKSNRLQMKKKKEAKISSSFKKYITSNS